ncbi:carbohydrate kinase [uncultured Maribacter sp.]|uniref:carbohydrate kinase family protein n=1 Tax=uncultured Maribacter sp. TaxID=431308 RepID=UPI00260281A3|nr:carbohydrate kinase [uncultured Maribacter sp.]
MKSVFCIGELLIDFIAKTEKNNLGKAKDFSRNPGGAPANVACAISKLGGLSNFIGSVGKDSFGSYLLEVLKDNNVDVSLAQRSDAFTTLAFVSLDEKGERDFVFSRGADEKLKYDSCIKKEFNNNIVHFGAATALLGGNLEDAYNRYFFDALTQNTFISFDPNFRSDLWNNQTDVFIKKCLPFIQKSHLCKFSLEEAQLLSGETNPIDCSGILHEIGAQVIVITLGKKGTLVSTNKKQKTIPSIEVKTVDTTGAGDAFIGCLLYQIASLTSTSTIMEDFSLLNKMVIKANKAGAYSTTGYGAISSLPNHNAVFNS